MLETRMIRVCFAVLAVVALTNGSAMFYKKNDNDKYEPDLIAVSSTVIPLTVYEASAALGDKSGGPALLSSLSDEYKHAYLKHLHKKVKSAGVQSPDRLITIKNQGRGDVVANVRST